ncbi:MULTISPECIES: MarR family winged helix-turn-helix transcriptional regulator [Sporosarcina]|uniref:MarR family winged helix-turn-helix transcriptional regulator n=1 Tax=Sporosarcina TaxID=1569 RepID=UPI00078C0262|nr:MarR family winged helix-turn-helix transcriptional regulator [Sporosarcina psychrophila]AMQ07836.1 hypothetical protein AZE41_18885 [Sporosarcina psychrophila]
MDNKRTDKLEQFQNVFQDVFGKMKAKQNFYPKTEYKLSNGHITILIHLHHVEKCRASDITNYLGITSGGCTVLTETLLKHNLIQKKRSPKDKRIVELTLTVEGEKIVDQIIKSRVMSFTQLLVDLEENELDQMISVFQKLNQKL